VRAGTTTAIQSCRSARSADDPKDWSLGAAGVWAGAQVGPCACCCMADLQSHGYLAQAPQDATSANLLGVACSAMRVRDICSAPGALRGGAGQLGGICLLSAALCRCIGTLAVQCTCGGAAGAVCVWACQRSSVLGCGVQGCACEATPRVACLGLCCAAPLRRCRSAAHEINVHQPWGRAVKFPLSLSAAEVCMCGDQTSSCVGMR